MKKHFFLTLCLLLLAIAGFAGTLSVFVRDAENGYGLKTEIVLTHNGISQTYTTPENGHLSFDGEGRYDLVITAAGHAQLKTWFELKPGDHVNADILLDRLIKTPVKFEKLNKAIIQGYVIDRETGKPLPGVNVSLQNEKKTITNKKGFFSLTSSQFSEMNSEKEKAVRKNVSFTKKGYTTYIKTDILMAPTRIILRVDLEKGSGEKTEKEFQHILDGTTEDVQEYEKNVPKEPSSKRSTQTASPQGCSLPTSIRVGTSCSCTTCSGVSVMSLQYYSESGIDDEWISSWNYNSLAAGSVPYRSYGGYYVNNPVNANYDIASTTCNQVWGATVYANAQTAAQATAGDALTSDGVNPARAEYSAQNNYGGTSYNCTDCNAGGSGLYACYSDNVCCGYTPAGHGRGMCQWGSQYWAQGGQTYQWIINHYYIATVGYSLCSSLANPPSSLAVQPSTCPGLGVTLSWQNSGTGWFVDVTDDATWTTFYNHDVTGLTSIVCPGGFQLYPSQGTYLQFQPNTTYYWRVWDGTTQTYGQQFTTGTCTYADNNCTGNFVDFGGISNPYNNNEDWTLTISPTNAINVSMSFTSFDLEDQFDYLYVHDGNSTAAPLIGTYTGLIGPGTFTSSGPDLTFHFISDPGVQHAGWNATWSCTQNTSGFSNIGAPKVFVFPTVSDGKFTIKTDRETAARIDIYDALGNEVLSTREPAFTQKQVDLTGKARGAYFVRVSGEDFQLRYRFFLQ